MTGNYHGNEIDYVQNINNALSCQEECQEHEGCQYWTYNLHTKICWRQTANAPETLGTCNTCIRGPRNCSRGK